VSPIYEKGLNDALKKVKLKATQDFDHILDSHITFLCGGTPGKNDGAIDLQYVNRPAEQLREVLKKKDDAHLVVVRSTVVPGTTEKTVLPYFKDLANVGICVNPEFLRMGTALEDFMVPSRIVIGENESKWGDILARIYSNFNRPIMRTDMKTAEMIKYASNACLATKISFINEIGNLCKKIGIDAHVVAQGMEFDDRIGHGQLRAGIGFGGSCFPKDLAALVAQGEEMGYEPNLLKQVIEVNREQPLRMLQLLKKHLPSLKGKVIGILGLAFKPDTDDTRESRAIPIINELLKEGAQIRAYDPQAMNNFHKLFPNIQYTNAEDVLDSDAVLILTEWDEFCALDYRKCIVIDGRRVQAANKARIYEGVCW
jgi:UDPglucose 6-dehydrogenase